MNTAVINIKVDPKTKKQAQETARGLGLSLSGAIKVLLKEFVRRKRLEVDVREEIPNARTRAILKQAEKDREKGKGSPVFKTGEEAVKWLEEQGI